MPDVAERLARALGILPLPGRADLKINLVLSVVFAILFGVVYVGADLLSASVYERNQAAFGFEANLPFVPQLAIVYLSIIPLLLLGPIVLETPRKLTPLVVVLSLEVLIAGIVYVLFPMAETFPSHQTDGATGFLFRVADTLNLNHNDLPSLHVALSLTAVAAYARSCSLPGKALYYFWGVLIAASSLLMHQHHIADIAAGALLAAAAMLFVYPVVSRAAFFDALRVECICASEFRSFSRRHPRYLVIAIFLYANAPLQWRRMRTMRAGFCLLQTIDDLLDGDRPTDTDPLVLANAIVGQLECGQFGSDRYSLLAKTLSGDLSRLPDAGEEALDDVVALIRHMTADRERALRRVLFDAGELRRHHRETFTRSLNLLLAVAGAQVRAAEVPALIEAFGWCSTMRDLREDLEHGLVNVPADVVAAAEAEGASLTDFDALIETHAVRVWFSRELERAQGLLSAFGDRTGDPADKTGERILRIFHRSIVRFARRFERRYLSTSQHHALQARN